MLLDALKDFEWYNEPENVRFTERGMVVTSKSKTDFWQSTHHNFHKDSGHFFFKRSTKDFELLVKWHFEKCSMFDQCGIMLRIDERNWFKLSIMSEDSLRQQLGTSLTNFGYSDWAIVDLPQTINDIWYKILRNGEDYVAYYSLDGQIFKQLRLFHLINDSGEIKAGVYTCAPQHSNFEATLEVLDLS